MSAKRVTLFLYQWQIDALREMNEHPQGTGYVGGLPLSHFIRNLISHAITKAKEAKAK